MDINDIVLNILYKNSKLSETTKTYCSLSKPATSKYIIFQLGKSLLDKRK